eukprot:863190-Amphidinium_carterae.1
MNLICINYCCNNYVATAIYDEMRQQSRLTFGHELNRQYGPLTNKEITEIPLCHFHIEHPDDEGSTTTWLDGSSPA